MNVYIFKNNNAFGGGGAIIIANSPEEAFGVLIRDCPWAMDCTDIAHCSELDSLLPRSEENIPRIIDYNFYTE